MGPWNINISIFILIEDIKVQSSCVIQGPAFEAVVAELEDDLEQGKEI